MRNKLNANQFFAAIAVVLMIVASIGCRAKQELPKFVPDDNAVDLPSSIAPDQQPPH